MTTNPRGEFLPSLLAELGHWAGVWALGRFRARRARRHELKVS